MKVLTIGITTYNNESFINNLLYEIEEQVKKDAKLLQEVDFILYDVNSTEKTFLNSISKFINVKIGEMNFSTPSKGRNVIVEYVVTKYVLFVDGDDLIIRSINDLVDILIKKSILTLRYIIR